MSLCFSLLSLAGGIPNSFQDQPVSVTNLGPLQNEVDPRCLAGYIPKFLFECVGDELPVAPVFALFVNVFSS